MKRLKCPYCERITRTDIAHCDHCLKNLPQSLINEGMKCEWTSGSTEWHKERALTFCESIPLDVSEIDDTKSDDNVALQIANLALRRDVVNLHQKCVERWKQYDAERQSHDITKRDLRKAIDAIEYAAASSGSSPSSGSALFQQIMASDYGSDLAHEFWDETPWITSAFTDEINSMRWHEIILWCEKHYGPERWPIHDKPGDWHTGCATVHGWTWVGFATKEMMTSFEVHWQNA